MKPTNHQELPEVSNRSRLRSGLVVGIVAIACLCRADAVMAQDAIKQFALTEQAVEGFITALPEMTRATAAAQGTAGPADRTLQDALDAIANKHGFANFQQFSDVSASIGLVLVGLDPKTKTFTEPRTTIEAEIVMLLQTLAELKDALKSAQSVTSPGNIELVKKYHDKTSAAATSK
jgi:hypothetical protein